MLPNESDETWTKPRGRHCRRTTNRDRRTHSKIPPNAKMNGLKMGVITIDPVNEHGFREDVAGLQATAKMLEECPDSNSREKVLGLMLLMLERLTIHVEDELQN